MYRIDTLIQAQIRSVYEDEFKNSNNEIIPYKQLQCERKDEKGRLEMFNISMPKQFWPEVEAFNKIMGKVCKISVGVTSGGAQLKLTLNQVPVPV